MSYQNYEEYMRSILGYMPYQQPTNDYVYSEPEDLYAYQNTEVMNMRNN